MNVLVVGGNDFLGPAILAHWARAAPNDIVYAASDDANFLRAAKGSGATPLAIDLDDEDAARKLPECDVCVYAAGSSDHGMTPAQSVLEAMPLVNLLAAFRGKLVLLSSGAVYYGHEGRVGEGAALANSFPYSLSKLVAERHVFHARNAGTLEAATVLRVFYPFGVGERPSRLIPRVLSALDRGETSFTLRGARDSVLDPVPAADVARAARAALLHQACDGRAFNVCGGEPITVRDFVGTVARLAGGSLETKLDGVPEDHPIGFWGDPTSLRQACGFERSPLDLALRERIAHWRARGE